MILTRIAVDRRIRFLSKYRFDLSLRSLGNELVFFGQMHQQGCIKAVDLAQIFLGVTAVINDRGIDAVTNGSKEGHQPAEAVAEDGTLPVHPAAWPQRWRCPNVFGAGVSVISLIKTKAVLPVGLGGDAESTPGS